MSSGVPFSAQRALRRYIPFRLHIDLLCQLGQLVVRSILFLPRRLQYLRQAIAAQDFSIGRHRTVARHLVMLKAAFPFSLPPPQFLPSTDVANSIPASVFT